MKSLNNNPKIELRPSLLDYVWLLSGLFLIIGLWTITIADFFGAPEILPSHFNVAGEPDAYHSSGFLYMLPIVGSVLYIGLHWLCRYPHLFNYPMPINKQNAEKNYRTSVHFMRYLAFALMLTFTAISIGSQLTGAGKISGLGTWFLPTLLTIIFLPLIMYIKRLKR